SMLEVPWIGLYRDRLSRTAFWLSATALPVGTVVFLTWKGIAAVDLGVRWNTQADCIRADLRGVTCDHGRANTGYARGSRTRIVRLQCVNITRAQANLW